MNKTAVARFAKILARIIEIFFWIGAVGLCAALVMLLLNQIGVDGLVSGTDGTVPENFEVLGISFGMLLPAEMIRACYFSFPFGIVICSLNAMIFRNIYLILVKVRADSENSFSSENSPFRPDIVRMIREIGIFAISVPVVTLIGQFVASLFFKEAYMSFNITEIAMGLAVLYLSTIFQYGQNLQEEVDDLV